MASHTFGKIFKITTWGEAHGPAVGAVIDGCPAGVEIKEEEIGMALASCTPRHVPFSQEEEEHAQILSGVFEGKTTGAPICLFIPNPKTDESSSPSGLPHSQRGGRTSGRETTCRVAAGAVAKKFLKGAGIEIIAYIKQMGTLEAEREGKDLKQLVEQIQQSPVFCPDPKASSAMLKLIEKMQKEGDSVGGIVEFIASSVPSGLGDPIYEKLEANLAHALMTLPATKGFEIGSGFDSVKMQGSTHNDLFILDDQGQIETKTNYAGGILGGISTGMPIIGRVAFKPASSLMQIQESTPSSKEKAIFQLPLSPWHDPCVAVHAVPVVEAMVAFVLVDALLLNRCARQ